MLEARDLYREMGEADRRLEQVVLYGQVVALDAVRARVRVQAGPLTTGWLPWAAHRAGADRDWRAPEVGEQVVVVSPGGDLEQGVVVGSLYREAHPAPAHSAEITRTVWKDGAVMEYDRARHHWRLSVPAGGQIVLEIGATRLTLRDDGTTLTTPRLLVEAEESTFTGSVLIKKLLTYLNGLLGKGGGGAAATISGDVHVEGNISASGSILDAGGNSNHHSH